MGAVQTDNLYESDIETIKNGFYYDSKKGIYTCAVCGASFENGEIYPVGGRFFDAERAVSAHVSEHGDRFSVLLDQDGKYLTLTENQRELFTLIRGGFTDAQIAVKTGISPSTARHQRFVFREKAKQARMYLAVYELATEKKQPEGEQILPVHGGAKMIDERYEVTTAESDKIIENAFSSLSPLKLKVFPAKEKKKLVILAKIAGQYEKGREYTEKEINAILKDIYDDYVTLRRYLIEYGFMKRTIDGGQYWLL